MSTATTEKVNIVPLYVHDGTRQKEDGSYTGTFDITTNKQHVVNSKWIADVKPYGGNFPDYEEAKVYAKLFAGAPDMAVAIRQYICKTENPYSSESDRTLAYENLKKSLYKAIL